MKETIILAPGINGTELLRSLSRHGKNSFGVRVMGTVEFARFCLMKCAIPAPENLMTADEETAVFSRIISKRISEGRTDFSHSPSDVKNLSGTLYRLRLLVTENELPTLEETLSRGEFPAKNKALLDLFREYSDRLKMENRTDRTGLIRYALEHCQTFDADFAVLQEASVSPLEKKLLSLVSGRNFRTVALPELFGVESPEYIAPAYTSAYGAKNEVEHIIGAIFANDTPLDSCTIALADGRSYSQLFFDVCREHGIPVTFGTGLPITNTNPAALLKKIVNWMTVGFYGKEYFADIVFSPYFDGRKLFNKIGAEEKEYKFQKQIIEAAGAMRLSFDDAENHRKLREYREALTALENICEDEEVAVKEEILLFCRNIAEELGQGIVYFISEYAKIRQSDLGSIDAAALSSICRSLSVGSDFSVEDLIPDILQGTVMRQNSDGGKLHVTTIQGALCSMRENLFVCGLGADKFPGSPRENYLVLDSDYLLFGEKNEVPTSTNVIEKKKKAFFELIDLANALGNKIYLSCSDFNVADIKSANPSSLLLARVKDSENPERVGYFESKISPIDSSLRQAVEKSFNFKGKSEGTQADDEIIDEIRISPSRIELFCKCPKRFYLTCIKKLEEIDDDNNIFETIPPNDMGTMVHKVCKLSCEISRQEERKLSEEEFLEVGEKVFDEYVKSHIPVNRTDLVRQKTDFETYVVNAHGFEERNSDNTITGAEENITVRYTADVDGKPVKFVLNGNLDRFEQKPDGSYIVADFKVKRRLEHLQDDMASCIQALVYAFMKELDKPELVGRISGVEFRYIMQEETISCGWGDRQRDFVKSILQDIAVAAEKNKFETCGKKDCGFCKYGNVCGKENE